MPHRIYVSFTPYDYAIINY